MCTDSVSSVIRMYELSIGGLSARVIKASQALPLQVVEYNFAYTIVRA